MIPRSLTLFLHTSPIFGIRLRLKCAHSSLSVGAAVEAVVAYLLLLLQNITHFFKLFFGLHKLVMILYTIKTQLLFLHLVVGFYEFVFTVAITKAILTLLTLMPLRHEIEFSLAVVAIFLFSVLVLPYLIIRIW